MNRKDLLFSLRICFVLLVFVAAFALPVLFIKAQANFQEAIQTANKLELEKAKLKAEIDKVKGDMFDLMGEMISMISEALSELTLNFNIYFKLIPETEESETATTTATTTEDVIAEEAMEQSAYYGGQTALPQATVSCPLPVTGQLVYTVSSISEPMVTQVALDPGNVEYDTVQTVMVDVADSNGLPITGVTGIATTDTATYPFELAQKSGTETSGTWQGSWTLKDSICLQLRIQIAASSGSGTSNFVISIR